MLNVQMRQMDDVAFPWQLSLQTQRIIGFACAATEQTYATGALAAIPLHELSQDSSVRTRQHTRRVFSWGSGRSISWRDAGQQRLTQNILNHIQAATAFV